MNKTPHPSDLSVEELSQRMAAAQSTDDRELTVDEQLDQDAEDGYFDDFDD